MADLPSFLRELSDTARAVTLGPGVPQADNKADGGEFDPVTHLDRAAERALRAAIEARFPEDGIEGEEYGLARGEARRRWVLDPIDGTRALICGLPSWTTLVALVEDGEPVAGFIDAPVLGELAMAWESGAVLQAGEERPLRVSECAELADARLATTDVFLFRGGEVDAFERVRRSVRVTRYGLDALAYAKLAAGSIDLVIESGLKTHDWSALVPVVRGAGGFIGNWEGGTDLSRGSIVAASSEKLFEQAIRTLAA